MADDIEHLDWEGFQKNVARIQRGDDKKFNPRPAFDRKLAEDVRKDRTEHRKIEDYMQALEYLGWRYIPAAGLAPMWGENGPILHTEGQWRNVIDKRRLRDVTGTPVLRMALTSKQICEWFPGGAEEFFTWYVDCRTKARAKLAGIVLPPSSKGIVLV